MGNEERLNDEALQNVTGGKGASPDKKSQFEAAWRMLGMTQKGYSGMKMAEIYASRGFDVEAESMIQLAKVASERAANE